MTSHFLKSAASSDHHNRENSVDNSKKHQRPSVQKKRTSLHLDNGSLKHQKDGKNLGISVGVGTEKTKMDANNNLDLANNDDDDDDDDDDDVL